MTNSRITCIALAATSLAWLAACVGPAPAGDNGSPSPKIHLTGDKDSKKKKKKEKEKEADRESTAAPTQSSPATNGFTSAPTSGGTGGAATGAGAAGAAAGAAAGSGLPKGADRFLRMGDAAQGLLGSVVEMPYEKENKIGQGVALTAFDSVGRLDEHQQVQRYVNLVGRSLVKNCSRPDIPYYFAVLDSTTPNAFAGPGGYIFITTGALKLMKNESELACVLAHEITHVTNRHAVKAIQRSTAALSVAQGVQAATKKDRAEYKQLADATNDILFRKGLGQEAEFESDRDGATLAAASGYNPDGLTSFLNTLKNTTNANGGWLLTSTHPPTTQRIAKLDQMFAAGQLGREGSVQTERFQKECAGPLAKPAPKPTQSEPASEVAPKAPSAPTGQSAPAGQSAPITVPGGRRY